MPVHTEVPGLHHLPAFLLPSGSWDRRGASLERRRGPRGSSGQGWLWPPYLKLVHSSSFSATFRSTSALTWESSSWILRVLVSSSSRAPWTRAWGL